MKKFVSLCAFVAALSFVSCGNKTNENASTDSLKNEAIEAVEAVVEKAEAVADSTAAPADSMATEMVEKVENL